MLWSIEVLLFGSDGGSQTDESVCAYDSSCCLRVQFFLKMFSFSFIHTEVALATLT